MYFVQPPIVAHRREGLESLESWLGDRKWDVIHFNFGLHDLKYMGPNNENLADPKAKGSHQQVPIDQYAANLKQIAERLKKTGATVIWCETTPVPEGSRGTRRGRFGKRYNDAAAKVDGGSRRNRDRSAVRLRQGTRRTKTGQRALQQSGIGEISRASRQKCPSRPGITQDAVDRVETQSARIPQTAC